MKIIDLRQLYHQQICKEIIRVRQDTKRDVEYPNFADSGNYSSVKIAAGIIKRLDYQIKNEIINEQRVGELFEADTRDFLEKSFGLLLHLRPGKWHFTTTQTATSKFNEHEDLTKLQQVIKNNKSLSAVLERDNILKPDIIVGRYPVEDEEVNQEGEIIEENDAIAALTPFRKTNSSKPNMILHASISCKWTIRSDRSQNTRTEALNLIRNRKGHLPHIVAVTAEPLPTRIATLALGTGDIDCVYHFALPELKNTLEELNNQDLLEPLVSMIEGKRLRDISDLPFDLAV
jgi:hypothetical protein